MGKEPEQQRHTPDLLEAIQAKRTREHRGGRFDFAPKGELPEELQRRKLTGEAKRLKDEMDSVYEEDLRIKITQDPNEGFNNPAPSRKPRKKR